MYVSSESDQTVEPRPRLQIATPHHAPISTDRRIRAAGGAENLAAQGAQIIHSDAGHEGPTSNFSLPWEALLVHDQAQSRISSKLGRVSGKIGAESVRAVAVTRGICVWRRR